MSIRLIASDVDGTILPRGGSISNRTRAAVRAAAERGVPFVIATGRWFLAARDVAEALGLAGDCAMIVANGGAVVDLSGAPLREWTLSREDAGRIWSILRRYDVMTTAFVRDAVFRMNTSAPGRPARIHPAGVYEDRFRVVDDDLPAFESEGLTAAYKLAAAGNPSQLVPLRGELSALGFGVSSAGADNLEIMAPGCGKGTALRWLAGRLGVSLADCMAFGDSANDLDMLKIAGWPVVMGNAEPGLKSMARVVAPDCADDGAAQIIERALRGEL